MSVIINPNDKEIDADLQKADKVLVFHNLKTTEQFEKVLDNTIDYGKNKVVYIHHYTKDKSYTVGIKELTEEHDEV